MPLCGEMCVGQWERLGQVRTMMATGISSLDTLKARPGPIQEADAFFLNSPIQALTVCKCNVSATYNSTKLAEGKRTQEPSKRRAPTKKSKQGENKSGANREKLKNIFRYEFHQCFRRISYWKTSEIFYHNFQLSISGTEGDEEKNENAEICKLGVKFMENILPFFQCVIAAMKYDTDALF
ncbi:hypothetical protein JEQ12_007082 [Ovis aries]|uniref:Uncharacterized protein n=1 Tax=Ovis aries TaxID=9940 RepID=A0A835ZR96_SHEEP|nr:hypothetical protein JEQ12_007082 [Ovis aries]